MCSSGANIQGGGRLGLFEHGRVILSSLEVVPDTDDQQYIHWQRCKGKKEAESSYGEQGDGLTGSGLPGMGPAGEEVIAFKDEAVMFVEIQYDYQPLIGDFIPHRETLSATASFNVRDSRDLSADLPARPGRSPIRSSTARCSTATRWARDPTPSGSRPSSPPRRSRGASISASFSRLAA